MGKGSEYCEVCKKSAEQTHSQTDCKTCPDRCPELLPENVPALSVWKKCCTQWRGGPNGVIGLDYSALQIVCDVYGEELTPGLLDRIRALERWQLLQFRSKEAT